MDPNKLAAMFGLDPATVPAEDAQPTAQLQSPDMGVDPDAARALVGHLVNGLAGSSDAEQQSDSQPATAPPPAVASDGEQPQSPDIAPPSQPASGGITTDQIEAARNSGWLGSLVKATEPPESVQAFATGGLKGVFEAKDFLFGEGPPERQSAVRKSIYADNEDLRQKAPILNGIASGIGQFSVAMMGLGKLGMVAKALPYVGEGVAAVEGLKGGSVALESGKAALAGAISFDPHEARLSNLIQGTFLANPISQWMAAKPGDSAAWGRVKNAMESLGVDAAIIGALKVGGTVLGRLKEGDTGGASRAVTDFDAERAAHEQQGAEQAGAQQQAPSPAFIPTAEAEGTPRADPLAQPVATGVPEGVGPTAAQDAAGRVGEPMPEGYQRVAPDGTPLEPTAQEAGQVAAIPDGTTADPVANPTAPVDGVNPAKPQPFKNAVDFNGSDIAGNPARPGAMDIPKPGLIDDVGISLENAEKDWDTLSTHGSWQGVMDGGGKLSPDMGAFYDRFKTDNDVTQYMDIAVSHKAEELAAQGFRVKLTDAKLQRQVNDFANLAGVDPAGLAGILQSAGEASKTLTAKMIVVGSLAAKAFQDASLLAMRRKIGDFSQFGSLEGMEQEIAKRFSLATTFLKLTDDIRSQGGRTLRANRGKPFDPSLFEGLSKNRFYDLLADAQANPALLKKLADPSLGRKILDTVNYMRIASLVSGPKTQLINIMSNGYMLGVRPLERILGAIPGVVIGREGSTSLIKENLKQYSYMGSAFFDGFGQAVKAFTRNDGLLSPHTSEAFGPSQRWQVPGTQSLGENYFKPWDSIPNLLHNAISVPLTVAGVAPRLLGGVDELVKQTVYRSKVAARANMEGVEQATQSGLKGKASRDFVSSYVSQRLDNAFDAEGRGVDPEALREANIATFQQDLLPGTYGKNIQNFINNDPTQLSRLILPFVKTPTNVIRYGWKMTPGLNMLQEEYRRMITGAMGPEAKAQAVGQMSMGALFMGSAAYIGAQGMITGGGPSNPQLKAQLLATGWQPYSIVVKHDDGTTTYIPFSRLDPVALPFGIIADIQDAYHIMADDADDHPDIQSAVGALTVSLAKQFSSRTYLLSLNQALDALTDPDANMTRFAGSMAQSFVPFSGATRQLNGDPFMRDARTITDKMMQVIPGMSSTLPPKYNWLGQPVLNRQGLWSSENDSLVDHEVIRLGLEGGTLMGPPSPKLASKVDLRTITMADGENAYVAYQRLSGQPTPKSRSLRDVIADAMRSPSYERAPDGEVGTRGTKLWLLAERINHYRAAAAARIRADPAVRTALQAAQRKVADHYAHLKAKPTAEQDAEFQAILKGFGAGKK